MKIQKTDLFKQHGRIITSGSDFFCNEDKFKESLYSRSGESVPKVEHDTFA
jgi:hypothetical protein